MPISLSSMSDLQLQYLSSLTDSDINTKYVFTDNSALSQLYVIINSDALLPISLPKIAELILEYNTTEGFTAELNALYPTYANEILATLDKAIKMTSFNLEDPRRAHTSSSGELFRQYDKIRFNSIEELLKHPHKASLLSAPATGAYKNCLDFFLDIFVRNIQTNTSPELYKWSSALHYLPTNSFLNPSPIPTQISLLSQHDTARGTFDCAPLTQRTIKLPIISKESEEIPEGTTTPQNMLTMFMEKLTPQERKSSLLDHFCPCRIDPRIEPDFLYVIPGNTTIPNIPHLQTLHITRPEEFVVLALALSNTDLTKARSDARSILQERHPLAQEHQISTTTSHISSRGENAPASALWVATL